VGFWLTISLIIDNIAIYLICDRAFVLYVYEQDAQLSQRDRAAVCVIVFAKSRTLELGDNDLRTL